VPAVVCSALTREPRTIARMTRRVARLVGCSALLDSRPGCYSTRVTFPIELEREDDGRWLAEVPLLAGVMCYGADRDEAVARVQALALRVLAERLEHREAPAEFLTVTFEAA
jgi:predicted RNase H-like HicB family nuclease